MAIYDPSGSLGVSGSADPTIFFATASGQITWNGTASSGIGFARFVYQPAGSLGCSGSVATHLTASPQVDGRLGFAGYCTVTWTVVFIPPTIAPYVLSELPKATRSKRQRPLARAYSREAVENGWWNAADSAYIPVGTAVGYAQLSRRKVTPGDGTEPHYGLIVTES